MKKPTQQQRQTAENAVNIAKAEAEFEPMLPESIEQAIHLTKEKLRLLENLRARFTDRSISVVEDSKNDLHLIMKM